VRRRRSAGRGNEPEGDRDRYGDEPQGVRRVPVWPEERSAVEISVDMVAKE